MTYAGDLSAFIRSTTRAIADASSVLRYFNEPDWPRLVERVLLSGKDLADLHGQSPQPSVADDYANLASVISQIRWPDVSMADTEDHLTRLRAAIGAFRMDIDQILRISEENGVRPSSMFNLISPELALVAKSGREAQLRAISARLEYVESLVRDTLEPEATSHSASISQSAIVGHFVKIVKLNVHIMQGALEIGDSFDMGLLERASSAIGSATSRFLSTVNSAASKATNSLKIAAEKVKFPIKRLLSRVRILVDKVSSDENPSELESNSENLSQHEAVEELKKIGEYLKGLRLSHEYSIRDLSDRTRIATWHLQSIENSDFSNSISLVYLSGFVRSYLKVFGSDDSEMVQRFRTAMIRSGYTQNSVLSELRFRPYL